MKMRTGIFVLTPGRSTTGTDAFALPKFRMSRYYHTANCLGARGRNLTRHPPLADGFSEPSVPNNLRHGRGSLPLPTHPLVRFPLTTAPAGAQASYRSLRTRCRPDAR